MKFAQFLLVCVFIATQTIFASSHAPERTCWYQWLIPSFIRDYTQQKKLDALHKQLEEIKKTCEYWPGENRLVRPVDEKERWELSKPVVENALTIQGVDPNAMRYFQYCDVIRAYSRQHSSDTLLSAKIRDGDTEYINFLLQHGVNLNKDSLTLNQAAMVKMAQLLLNNGAKIEAASQSLLHDVIIDKHEGELLSLYVARGVPVDSVTAHLELPSSENDHSGFVHERMGTGVIYRLYSSYPAYTQRGLYPGQLQYPRFGGYCPEHMSVLGKKYETKYHKNTYQTPLSMAIGSVDYSKRLIALGASLVTYHKLDESERVVSINVPHRIKMEIVGLQHENNQNPHFTRLRQTMIEGVDARRAAIKNELEDNGVAAVCATLILDYSDPTYTSVEALHLR